MINLKKSHNIIIFIVIASLIYFIAGMIWIDVVDPAFIPNPLYHQFVYFIGPVISLLITCYLFYIGLKRYKTDESYQWNIKSNYDDFNPKGRCKFFFTVLSFPFFIYFIIWSIGVSSIELSGYYFYRQTWAQEYYLVEVDSCGSDYGSNCSLIKLLDFATTDNIKFRLYESRDKLRHLQNQRVNVLGYQGIFGHTVEEIQW